MSPLALFTPAIAFPASLNLLVPCSTRLANKSSPESIPSKSISFELIIVSGKIFVSFELLILLPTTTISSTSLVIWETVISGKNNNKIIKSTLCALYILSGNKLLIIFFSYGFNCVNYLINNDETNYQIHIPIPM